MIRTSAVNDHLRTLSTLLQSRQLEIIRHTTELARIESPSDNKTAVNEAVSLVESWCIELGGTTSRHQAGEFGDLLEAHFDPPVTPVEDVPTLLLGHLDTVWQVGTEAEMPVRVADGRLHGPGVFDMKAGVVMALEALRAMLDLELLARPVTLLMVSDEEIGSPASRSATEKLALQSREVFVLEPAQGREGAYKTSRKGVGEYLLRVEGVASHSGVDFEAGHSAILELGHQLNRIASLTNLSRGLTLNPGVITGGTRTNVVAANAAVSIDVRVRQPEDAAFVEDHLRSLKPFDPACSLNLSGGLNRPPMVRSEGTVRLFEKAKALANGLGFQLREAATGGGSDGNFTSALGVATLDGMGAVGEGAHARNESVLIDELVPRTALLAAMLLD